MSSGLKTQDLSAPTPEWLALASLTRKCLNAQLNGILTFAIATSIGSALLSGLTPGNKTIETLLLVVIALCFLVVLLVGVLVLPLLSRADAWMTELYGTPNGAKAAVLLENVPACKSYQEEVLKQGREFVELDYVLMRELASRSTGAKAFKEADLVKNMLKKQGSDVKAAPTEPAAAQVTHPVASAASSAPSFEPVPEALANKNIRDLALELMCCSPLNISQIGHARSIAADPSNPMRAVAQRYLALLDEQLKRGLSTYGGSASR